jgi:hypothetical protein
MKSATIIAVLSAMVALHLPARTYFVFVGSKGKTIP